MENRIKEQQIDLFADRTSTRTFLANRLRLYLSSFAYVLMHGLRQMGLAGTNMAKAQCATLRNKLLKIAAHVHITTRKVRLSYSSVYPYREEFARVLVSPQSQTWSGPPPDNVVPFLWHEPAGVSIIRLTAPLAPEVAETEHSRHETRPRHVTRTLVFDQHYFTHGRFAAGLTAMRKIGARISTLNPRFPLSSSAPSTANDDKASV